MMSRRRSGLNLVGALVVPLAVSAALSPLRTHVANAALALVLTAVLVAIVSFGDRLAGLLASLSCGLWFDFFLTRPYDRFSISSAHDVETTVALLVVGLAVTEIAVRSRRYYSVASAEGDYLARIRDLSDLVATGAAVESVIALAEADLAELLALASCRFEAGPGPGGAEAGGGRARLGRNGEVQLGEWIFDVGRDGMPTGEVELVAEHRGVRTGAFVMVARGRRPVAIEPRVVALALADQVGAALSGSLAPEPH